MICLKGGHHICIPALSFPFFLTLKLPWKLSSGISCVVRGVWWTDRLVILPTGTPWSGHCCDRSTCLGGTWILVPRLEYQWFVMIALQVRNRIPMWIYWVDVVSGFGVWSMSWIHVRWSQDILHSPRSSIPLIKRAKTTDRCTVYVKKKRPTSSKYLQMFPMLFLKMVSVTVPSLS